MKNRFLKMQYPYEIHILRTRQNFRYELHISWLLGPLFCYFASLIKDCSHKSFGTFQLGMLKSVIKSVKGKNKSNSVDLNDSDIKPVKIRTIRVSQIICSDLINVDFMGKNDPYIVIEYCGHELRTEPISNAGENATFTNLDFKLEVEKNMIREESMIVSVYDYNDVIAHGLIGCGEVSLISVLDYTPKTVIKILVTLAGVKKTQICGKVTLFISMDPKPTHGLFESTTSTLQNSTKKVIKSVNIFKSSSTDSTASTSSSTSSLIPPMIRDKNIAYTLNVSCIQCSNLRNVELLGKNDPFVVLELGSSSIETEAIDNAGANAIFEDKNMMMECITENILIENELKVSVYDHNDLRAHVLIGAGQISLSSIFNTPLGIEVQMLVNLSPANSGTVKLWVSLNSMSSMLKKQTISGASCSNEVVSNANEVLSPLQAGRVAASENDTTTVSYPPYKQEPARPAPTSGNVVSSRLRKFRIVRIECRDMLGVDSTGENDPYVVVQFLGQSHKTKHILNGGSNVVFDNLNMCFSNVNEVDISQIPLAVTAFDYNKIVAHVEIGSGTVSLAALLDSSSASDKALFQEIKFIVQLQRVSNKKNKVSLTGTVELSVVLDPLDNMKRDCRRMLINISRNFCCCCFKPKGMEPVNKEIS